MRERLTYIQYIQEYIDTENSKKSGVTDDIVPSLDVRLDGCTAEDMKVYFEYIGVNACFCNA